MIRKSISIVYFFLCISAMLILLLIVIPAMEKLIPTIYLNELNNREVDPRALFYTESDHALDAYQIIRETETP